MGCDIQDCLYCAIEPHYCVQCNEGFELFTEPRSNRQKCINISTIYFRATLASEHCQEMRDLGTENELLDIGPEFACVECDTGYDLVGGYCVPKIISGDFPCNVSNCEVCS